MITEKFIDLFDFQVKSKIKAGEGLEKGAYPFYTSSSTLKKWIDKAQFFNNSLIFGTGGSASIHYAEERFSVSTDCLVAVAKKNKLFNTKFVYYYIFNNIQILEKGFRGAGLKHISKSHIQNLEIPLPQLEIQDKIVAILDKVKNLIDKREKSIDSYDELIQTIFFDMFGDPGKNSKGWQVKKLRHHIRFIGDIGSNGSNALITENLIMKDEEDYAIMVRTTNLRSNDFTNKVKYVSKNTYDFFEKTKIYGGEIIMNKIGSGAGDIWIMPLLNKKASLGLNQLVIKPENLNNVFLFHYLHTQYGKMIVKSKVRGAAIKSITKTAINELSIIYPPIELQNQFATKVNIIELIKQKKQSSLLFMQNLFISLSQLAFNDELKFNTAVDLEVLMENDYEFFKKNSNKKVIELLLERLDKNELNTNKFYERELYDKAKSFVFELLIEGKVKQIYDDKSNITKLTVQ